MTNAIYPKYKQSLLNGDANSDLAQTSASLAPFVALVNISTYTYSSSHQYYSDLSGIVGTDQQITTPSVTNGTFNGASVTFTSVTGSTVGALVIYRKNAGANTTWRLVLYEDTSVTGLPVTPNGGNIVITWNGSGIFTISDARLKKDIRQVGKLGPLSVYEYSYVGESKSSRHRGFLAQEVQRYSPTSITNFKHRGKTRKAVDYARVFEDLKLAV